MNDLIKFLLGESDFNGFWFGEHPPRKPFFWRKHLRHEWEQQQQRIAELERQLADAKALQSHSNHLVKLKTENQELAATVEDYRNRYERKDLVWFERCEVGGLDPEQVGFIDLNAVKREVAKCAFLAGCVASIKNRQKFEVFDPNTASDAYANTKYPNGKDGE